MIPQGVAIFSKFNELVPRTSSFIEKQVLSHNEYPKHSAFNGLCQMRRISRDHYHN
jgi:hypothetical protein